MPFGKKGEKRKKGYWLLAGPALFLRVAKTAMTIMTTIATTASAAMVPVSTAVAAGVVVLVLADVV